MRVDDGGQFLLLELFDSVLVISQVQLGAHQDDGSVGAVVSHLRVPLRRKEEAEGQDTDGGWMGAGGKDFCLFPGSKIRTETC